VGFDPHFFRRQVKARSTVNAISIEQGHGRHVKPGASRHQILRQGRTFKETESRAGVKFNVQVLSSQFSVLSKDFLHCRVRKVTTEN
jgi:hypothetical protein